jgi:hypothetical protein
LWSTAGLIAGAESCSVTEPNPHHTRPGMVSQSNDGDPALIKHIEK